MSTARPPTFPQSPNEVNLKQNYGSLYGWRKQQRSWGLCKYRHCRTRDFGKKTKKGQPKHRSQTQRNIIFAFLVCKEDTPPSFRLLTARFRPADPVRGGHSLVGEPAGLLQLVRALPPAMPPEGVADAHGPPGLHQGRQPEPRNGRRSLEGRGELQAAALTPDPLHRPQSRGG